MNLFVYYDEKSKYRRRLKSVNSCHISLLLYHRFKSVIISGHTVQALLPRCLCHLHSDLIEQSWSSVISRSGWMMSITLSITPHLPSVHCLQPVLMHLLLKRNLFSGLLPDWAIETNSSFTRSFLLIKEIRPFRCTMPRRTAPFSHRALGHKKAIL